MALAHPPLLTRPRVFCFSFFLSIVFVGCRLCTRSSYMTCAVFVVVNVVFGVVCWCCHFLIAVVVVDVAVGCWVLWIECAPFGEMRTRVCECVCMFLRYTRGAWWKLTKEITKKQELE